MRILVAEDERSLASVIGKRLTAEGYSVDICHNGLDALEYINAADYDIALLDVMMPGADGFEVVRRMRGANIRTPVLFLTAKDSISDRVTGLDSGGDDYLVKPFAFDELLARLRALSRREISHASNVFTLADLVVNAQTHAVTRAGRDIRLTAREYAILEYMIRNAGIVLSRGRIEQHIWNFDYAGASNMVDVYMRYLRKKIDEGFDGKLIHTVRYAGYVLREET